MQLLPAWHLSVRRSGAMSSRRTVRRSGGAAVWGENEQQATSSGDDESVYAGSSSSNGRGSSCGSSLSSDGYLHSVDSCCCGRDGSGGHYEEIRDDWTLQLRLSAERHLRRFCVYPKAASGHFIQTQSRWATSSLLCGVSALLAACSLSGLTVCIAVTGFDLTPNEPSQAASGAVERDFERNEDIANGRQSYRGAERLLLTPLAEYRVSHQNNSALRSEWTARYSWDCIAQPGLAKCRPVQKAQSFRDGPLSSHHQHNRPIAALHVLANGTYHVSVQITGKLWLAPPTLLRAVIARIRPTSGAVNMTTAHMITGAAGSSHSLLRGRFSVYTAAAMRLGAGDELLANVVCVEQPDCIVHVNGTTSYLTIERLD